MPLEDIGEYKAFFFDHDDTLVATRVAKWAHHKHVAKTFYKKELSDDEILLHWGKPLSKLVCLLYGIENPAEAFAHLASCDASFPKKLYDQTVPTLQYLHDLGKLIGIITATSRVSFEHDLDLHKIPRGLIDYTQTEDDTQFHKPDPRVFEPAIIWLAERQINPNEVLYVGDGLHDMEAALGAGFNFRGVHTGLVTPEEFLRQGALSLPGVGDLIRETTFQI